MRVTDEMVEAACAALYPEAWRKSYYDHQRAAARADMRAALEAALDAAPDDKLREAAKTALEVLEMVRSQVVGGIPLGSLHAAQEALRKALEGKE